MANDRQVPIEALLTRSDWVRRLARHLAGDDADDLLQETWVAARRSPPDEDRPALPWLAQVLRNLVHTRRRDDARRRVRESTYEGTMPDNVGSVDEAYERLELHRFLAEAVMALDETLRTVVVLRYFEGLDSARIAALTGTPPGTVRWRLKVALDQLRSTLDSQQGKQRAWSALLGPLAGTHRAPTPTRVIMASIKTKGLTIGGALVLALLVLLSGWWLITGRPAFLQHNQSAAGPSASTAPHPIGAKPIAPPHLLPTLTGPAGGDFDREVTDLVGCRQALSQSDELAQLRAREARGLVPAVAFAAGAANPRLQDSVKSQVDRLLNNSSLPDRHIECRSWACRVAIVVPNDGGSDVQAWIRSLGAWVPLLIDGLPRLTADGPMPLGMVQQWGGGGASRDLLAGSKMEEFVFFIGAPPGSTPDADPLPSKLESPPTLEACRRELAASRARIRELELQLAGFQPPPSVFQSAAQAPQLTERIQALANAALGATQRPTVECRESLCRLHFSEAPSADVFARLRADEHLGGSVPGARRIGTDIYMTVRESAFAVLRRLREPIHDPAFFADCPTPAQDGSLLLRLSVPQTGDVNDAGVPGRPSVRALGGTLAATPAATCLVDRMSTLLAVELPAPINGALRLETWTWRAGQGPVLATPD